MTTEVDRILVAIGPSDRGHVDDLLDFTEDIAGPADATVYLHHVFTQDEYSQLVESLGGSSATERLQPDELAARHDDIRTPADRLQERDIEVQIRGTIGRPEREVVRLTDDLDVDLLVIGGEGKSPTGKAVFGDKSQQILLNAGCPVTYVQRDE